MKHKILLPAIILLLSACTSQTYYQLVEVDTKSMVENGEGISSENKDVKVSYDFWANGGNGSFTVQNNTDKDIFIDLKRSHLIINGFAYTYYQNRNFSTPKVSILSSSTDDEIVKQRSIKLPGVSDRKVPIQSADIVSFNEERIICLPPHSSKLVHGFDLQNEIYRDCALYRFPSSKQIVSSEFDYSTSPMTYKNRITYSFDESMTTVLNIENEFWAKKITNLPENNFVTYESIKFCSDSSSYKTIAFPNEKPSSYYFKYKLEPGRLDH